MSADLTPFVSSQPEIFTLEISKKKKKKKKSSRTEEGWGEVGGHRTRKIIF